MNSVFEALGYLDDMAHGRKMNLDPNELKLTIEKELKALEIIKKHIRVYKIQHFGEQIIPVDSYLEKEEYDLLKEVLL